MDRSVAKLGCGARIVLIDSLGDAVDRTLRFTFKVSDNATEYKALIPRI